MADPGGEHGGIADTVAALWDQSRRRALERVAVLEDAVASLMAGELDDRARDEGHSLAGALGTFGIPAGSTTARRIELADAPSLAEQVLALRRAVEVAASTQAAAGFASPRAAPLLAAAAERGWRVSTAATAPDASCASGA